MIDRLAKLDFLGLFHEDHRLYDEVLGQLISFVKNSLYSLVKNNASEVSLESVQKGLTALLLFSLAFGDFSFWLKALECLDEIAESELNPDTDEKICQFVAASILPTLATLNLKTQAAQRLHLMQDTVPEDFFRICHYDLKEAAQTAITCDEEYIYLCIASKSGGIYKIGTGNKLTKPGKVYIYKPASMVADHLKMVVIGDTIYRSYQGCEFGTIKTNSKLTLEPTEDIQLNCPLVKADSANLRINKFIPLMTDGKHLFAIFKTLQLDIIEDSGPIKEKEPIPTSTTTTPQPSAAQMLLKVGGARPVDSYKELPRPSARVSAEVRLDEDQIRESLAQASVMLERVQDRMQDIRADIMNKHPRKAISRASLGPQASLIPPVPPMPRGGAYFDSDNVAPEDAEMIMQVLAEEQGAEMWEFHPLPHVPNLSLANEGSIKLGPKNPSSQEPVIQAEEKKPEENKPDKKLDDKVEIKHGGDKKEEKKKHHEKKSDRRKSNDQKPAPASQQPEQGSNKEEKKPEPVQPVKEEEKKPEEIKPDVFIEIEGFLQELIEAYFTQEREAEIAARWTVYQDKQKAKGVIEANKSEAQKKEDDPNLKLNKEDPNQNPASIKKVSKSKPKEKQAIKPAAEPLEKDKTGIMNFWLYRYDLANSLDEISEELYKDNAGVMELQESFAGLFSLKECAHAFKLSQEDVVLAAQWLIEEGERQRNKKCVNYDQITLLAQGEIDPRCLKAKGAGKPNSDEIILIHSVLTDKHLQEECILHNGSVLIGKNLYFSADPKDEYELPDEIMPLVMQEKKFVTPDRTRNAMRTFLKGREGLEDIGFEVVVGGGGNSPTPDMEQAFKLYCNSIMNISEELKQYTVHGYGRPLAGVGGGLAPLERRSSGNGGLFQLPSSMYHLEDLGLPIPPHYLKDDKERDRERERRQDRREERKELQKTPAPTEVKVASASIQGKNSAKKLRGTFICRLHTALERQEMFNPRCYDSVNNVAYSLSLGKKNSWLQNPGLIVKSRDPIGYQKSFPLGLLTETEILPRGKIFFDGLKEVSYGSAENDMGITEDQKKYFEKFSLSLTGFKSVKEIRELLCRLLTFINTKRFSLPFKFSDPLEALNKHLKDLDSQIKRTSNGNDKKLLQTKKLKIQAKADKLLKLYPQPEKKKKEKIILPKDGAPAEPSAKDMDEKLPVLNQKILENKRQYSYCPIGSTLELDLIIKSLNHSLEKQIQPQIEFYMNLLLFWSNHLSGELDVQKTKDLAKFIITKIEQDTLPKHLLCKLETVLIRIIYMLTEDRELVQSILKLALNRKGPHAETYEDTKSRAGTLEINHLNSNSSSLLDKLFIVLCMAKHSDIFHPYNQAEVGHKGDGNWRSKAPDLRFKLHRDFCLMSKVSEGSGVKPETLFSFLLLLQDSIIENPVNLELLEKWKIYYSHFFNVWILIEAAPKDESTQKTVRELVTLALTFVERCVEQIEKDNLKNLEVHGIVLEYLLCIVNIATVYTIKPKASNKVMVDSDFFANKTLRVMGTLMKIFRKVDTLSQGRLTATLKLSSEGLDTNQQTIFETCHPLNRGENVKANTLSHPDAIGIVVQLDKRCQSDPGKDILSAYSWDADQIPVGQRVEQNLNTNSIQKVNIGIGFRASGSMNNEEILLLVGDHAKLHFEANNKSLDSDKSFKRWGYRARTMPLYGYESSLLVANEGNNTIPPKIRSFGSTIIQLLNRLTVSLIKEIEPFLKGKRLSFDEKKAQTYLDWTLMKSGLNSLRRDLFLQDYKQGLKLTQKMKETLSKAIVVEDDSKGNKSVEETERLSTGSKGDLDKDFLTDSQLTDLLSRLQNNDEFIMGLVKAVKDMQDVPRLLKSEKLRPKFTKDLQKRWENSENLVLLALLHHSGLLKLLLNTNSKIQATNFFSLKSVREQLEQICQKKNDILNKMVSELQTERELSQTAEAMLDHLRSLVAEIKDSRVMKQDSPKEAVPEETKLVEAKQTSKEALMSKMDTLKEKYSKKKIGKKSDHIKKDKDKDKDKKKDKEAKPVEKKEEAVIKESEMADKDLPKVTLIEQDKPIIELFFENLLNKTDVQESIANVLKEGQLSEANHLETVLISRGLPYLFDDPEQNKREIIKLLRQALTKAEQESTAIENPYVRVANKIDERCFFLLKLATKFSMTPGQGKEEGDDLEGDDLSEQMDGEDDLPVLDITRSLSSTGPGRKNSNKQEGRMEGLEKRVDLLGEWISHYKKWKRSTQTEETSLQSDACSFLFSVGSFLTHREPIDTKKLEKVLLRVAQRACFRALGLDMIKDFLQFAHDTWLSKYLTGIFSSPFK